MMTVRKKGKVYIPTQEVQKWQQKFQKLELEEADKTLLKGLIWKQVKLQFLSISVQKI